MAEESSCRTWEVRDVFEACSPASEVIGQQGDDSGTGASDSMHVSVGARRGRGALWGVLEMSSRKVSARWEPGPVRCEVAADGFIIPVDEPVSVGGTGAAPQPTDLFLASLASCFTLALVHSAGKRMIALSSVRVDVVGDYAAGRRFDAVHLIVDIVGPSPEELGDLLRAAERVCYVTNTLRAGVRVTMDVG